MKRTLALMLAAVMAQPALADCFARSTSVTDIPLRIERISELRREVLPAARDGLTCRASFKALINGQWYPVEGESTGKLNDNLDGLCANAEQMGRAKILTDIGGSNISVSTDMMCTDRENTRFRTVQVGEILRQSEVAPNPQKPGSFQYMGTECRWFLETIPLGVGGMGQNQGVICRLRGDDWVVRDKWIQVVDR